MYSNVVVQNGFNFYVNRPAREPLTSQMRVSCVLSHAWTTWT